MNDPFEDIQAYLAAQSYENVFIDGFVVYPIEDIKNNNQINIQGEPSSTDIEVGYRELIWGIYVKNKDKETAKNIAKSIRKLLLNKGGKLVVGANSVVFKKIWIVTEPYFWGKTSNNQEIYLTRYKAVISDTDINTVYND